MGRDNDKADIIILGIIGKAFSCSSGNDFGFQAHPIQCELIHHAIQILLGIRFPA